MAFTTRLDAGHPDLSGYGDSIKDLAFLIRRADRLLAVAAEDLRA
jgi:hypothetical protein